MGNTLCGSWKKEDLTPDGGFFFLTRGFFPANIQKLATPKKTVTIQTGPFFQLDIRDVFKGRL